MALRKQENVCKFILSRDSNIEKARDSPSARSKFFSIGIFTVAFRWCHCFTMVPSLSGICIERGLTYLVVCRCGLIFFLSCMLYTWGPSLIWWSILLCGKVTYLSGMVERGLLSSPGGLISRTLETRELQAAICSYGKNFLAQYIRVNLSLFVWR